MASRRLGGAMAGINVDEIPHSHGLPGCYRRVMTSQKLENFAHLRRAWI
jgi:hypothetical protein